MLIAVNKQGFALLSDDARLKVEYQSAIQDNAAKQGRRLRTRRAAPQRVVWLGRSGRPLQIRIVMIQQASQWNVGESGGCGPSPRAHFGKLPELSSRRPPVREACLARCVKSSGSITGIGCWICLTSFLPSLCLAN